MVRGIFLNRAVAEYLYVDGVVFILLGGMFAMIHAVGPLRIV
jgi:hypothetical protein